MSSRIAPATKKVSNTPQNISADDMSKFQQDLNILTQKIADIQGTSINPGFVGGLRTSIEIERKIESSDKITILENILSKVVELDRHILKQTGLDIVVDKLSEQSLIFFFLFFQFIEPQTNETVSNGKRRHSRGFFFKKKSLNLHT